jgi:hypothetical protein
MYLVTIRELSSPGPDLRVLQLDELCQPVVWVGRFVYQFRVRVREPCQRRHV